MISNNCFTVEFSENYTNEKKIGGVNIILNTDVNNAQFVNRIGILKSLPINYSGELREGMKVVTHHNIARISKGYNGEKVNDWQIKNNLYRVPQELLLLFEKDDSWYSYGEFCFVKPIENEKIEKLGSIIIPENIQEKHISYIGEMYFPNKHLDVEKSETVLFKRNSEHRFEIDGVVIYKMNINRVLFRKFRTGENPPSNSKEFTLLKEWVLL